MHPKRFDQAGEVITEGKTKIIFEDLNDKANVFIESKDAITAGDGESKITIEKKGFFATTITSNCFRLLNKKGVPTHFIAQADGNVFHARRLKMCSVEIVTRRIAVGSYLKRHPYEPKGKRFARPHVEFFIKDDAMRDPQMHWVPAIGRYALYKANVPIGNEGSRIGELSPGENPLLPQHDGDIDMLIELATECFVIIEDAFARTGVTLADLKIECGRDADGTFCIGDVVDNESGRLWIGGDENHALDKDYFRTIAKKGRPLTPAEHAKIAADYAVVAHISSIPMFIE